ncbi:MAG: GWxTD domain-containing protein, partial [Candidatus Zixiibacteriota bacterium]
IAVFSQEDDSLAYVYCEAYDLAYSETEPSAWEGSLTIFDETGEVFRTVQPQILKKAGSTAVLTKKLPLENWPAGRYRLQVVALDLSTNQADTTSINMLLLPPRDVLQTIFKPQTGDPYDTLSLEVKVHLVKYLLSPDQLVTLERLTDRGKENFLTQYWREHDNDPATPVVENRMELLERYNYSNQYFSTNEERTDGWRTDRGRILMTYGPWEEIDDRQSPIVGNPYQVWYYHSLKEGKFFVFEDWTGNYDYRLVHSNVYGEVYSAEWQERLDRDLSTERPQDF